VADRGGLPAAAATAAASAAGPALAPESPGYSSGLEDLGEFWYRTGKAGVNRLFRCSAVFAFFIFALLGLRWL
jgi:hypothetical protein